MGLCRAATLTPIAVDASAVVTSAHGLGEADAGAAVVKADAATIPTARAKECMMRGIGAAIDSHRAGILRCWAHNPCMANKVQIKEAVPILPSLDLDVTSKFYARLGFVEDDRWPDEYTDRLT